LELIESIHYQDAFNTYNQLEEFWLSHLPEIHRARARFRISQVLKFIGWLAAAILSGLVSEIIFN
jgi:hypothetical protein